MPSIVALGGGLIIVPVTALTSIEVMIRILAAPVCFRFQTARCRVGTRCARLALLGVCVVNGSGSEVDPTVDPKVEVVSLLIGFVFRLGRR